MQKQYCAGRIVASRGPGEPLFFLFSYEARSSTRDCVTEIAYRVEDYLRSQNFCLTKFGVLGYCQGQKIKVFDSEKSTQVHEEAHRQLHKIWPDIDRSFNEGWAYALEDHLFDKTDIKKRREASLRLCSFHETASKKLLNGGLSQEGLAEMKLLTKSVNIGYTGDNWTSFLKAALNFRYYAIFADILDVFGPDQAEEWVWEAAYLGKQYGLDIALRTLMPITGFHSVFIDDKDEKLSTETLSAKHELGVCVLNDLPVWIPGMFNEKPGIHVENKKGDLVLKVWTMSENPLFPVGEIINKKLNELEHLGGLTAWNYRKDLTWHLENKL